MPLLTIRDAVVGAIALGLRELVPLLRSSVERKTSEAEERQKVARKVGRGIRAVSQALTYWARLDARHEAITPPVIQEASRKLDYVERSKDLWPKLDDQALEEELEDWFGEVQGEIEFASGYLAPFSRLLRQDRADLDTHRWIGQPSDVAGLGHDGFELADRLDFQGRSWVARTLVKAWRWTRGAWAQRFRRGTVRLDED